MTAQQPFHHFVHRSRRPAILLERLHPVADDAQLFGAGWRLFIAVGTLQGGGGLAGCHESILRLACRLGKLCRPKEVFCIPVTRIFRKFLNDQLDDRRFIPV